MTAEGHEVVAPIHSIAASETLTPVGSRYAATWWVTVHRDAVAVEVPRPVAASQLAPVDTPTPPTTGGAVSASSVSDLVGRSVPGDLLSTQATSLLRSTAAPAGSFDLDQVAAAAAPSGSIRVGEGSEGRRVGGAVALEASTSGGRAAFDVSYPAEPWSIRLSQYPSQQRRRCRSSTRSTTARPRPTRPTATCAAWSCSGPVPASSPVAAARPAAVPPPDEPVSLATSPPRPRPARGPRSGERRHGRGRQRASTRTPPGRPSPTP